MDFCKSAIFHSVLVLLIIRISIISPSKNDPKYFLLFALGIQMLDFRDLTERGMATLFAMHEY